jgi:hypothetical protein
MTDEELKFGPEIADWLKRLRDGDINAADALYDLSSNTLTPDKQQALEKLVHIELDKLEM